MKKAVIFDLFGTLCVSVDPEAEIIKYFGLNSSLYTEIEKAVCTPKHLDKKRFIEAIVKSASIPDTQNSRKRIEEIIESTLKSAKVFPSSEETLNYFLERGYEIGLISNATLGSRKILERANILKYFNPHGTFLSYESGLLKPSPEIFLRCLQGLQVSANNAVMIGDSMNNDVIGSKRSTKGKIKAILISSKGLPNVKGYNYETARELSYVPEIVSRILPVK